jgi:hypothetical protein
VNPLLTKEKITNAAGVTPEDGVTRIDPTAALAEAPEVRSRKKLRLWTE